MKIQANQLSQIQKELEMLQKLIMNYVIEITQKKKEFKNAKGLNAAAKANEKIKHTKDYLEKDTKKEYKDEPEDVAKPQFKSNLKEGDENFVELNKNEDVSIIHFNFKLLMI